MSEPIFITKESLDMIIDMVESYLITSDHVEAEVNLFNHLLGLQADNNRNNQGFKCKV